MPFDFRYLRQLHRVEDIFGTVKDGIMGKTGDLRVWHPEVWHPTAVFYGAVTIVIIYYVLKFALTPVQPREKRE